MQKKAKSQKDNSYTAQRVMRALVYIQEHLDEEIQLEDVARAAAVSTYHFHRLFRGFIGETLHAFIQRLRLDKARGLLKYTDEAVTQIALSSGYDTPSAFAKAFKKTTGLTSQQYRLRTKFLKRKTFHTEEKIIMNPTIQTLETLSVLFVRETGSYEETPKKAWDALLRFASAKKVDIQREHLISMSWDDPSITFPEKLRFDACITAPVTVKEEGNVARQQLRGGRYAIFLHKGPYSELEKTFTWIFTHWFPKSREQIDESPCFCRHLNMDEERMKTNPETLLTEICIPLK